MSASLPGWWSPVGLPAHLSQIALFFSPLSCFGNFPFRQFPAPSFFGHFRFWAIIILSGEVGSFNCVLPFFLSAAIGARKYRIPSDLRSSTVQPSCQYCGRGLHGNPRCCRFSLFAISLFCLFIQSSPFPAGPSWCRVACDKPAGLPLVPQQKQAAAAKLC